MVDAGTVRQLLLGVHELLPPATDGVPEPLPDVIRRPLAMDPTVRPALAAGAAGCGRSSAPPAAPADPTVHYKESLGGGVGPIDGRRSREYQGPAPQAARALSL